MRAHDRVPMTGRYIMLAPRSLPPLFAPETRRRICVVVSGAEKRGRSEGAYTADHWGKGSR